MIDRCLIELPQSHIETRKKALTIFPQMGTQCSAMAMRKSCQARRFRRPICSSLLSWSSKIEGRHVCRALHRDLRLEHCKLDHQNRENHFVLPLQVSGAKKCNNNRWDNGAGQVKPHVCKCQREAKPAMSTETATSATATVKVKEAAQMQTRKQQGGGRHKDE